MNQDESESLRMLVMAIQDMRWSSISAIIGMYLDEMDSRSVYDIIKSGDVAMFDFQGETYQLAGIEDGSPKFRKFGSVEIISPPFRLEDKVTRIF